jgi:MoaA/NifB/PqqE/SkfB family radical SAM enzyme
MTARRVNPIRLRVEATPACQLKCPSCPTASGETRPLLGRGYLKVEDFVRLLDANPQIRHVELSNYGELFLHPDLIGIMQAAHQRNVTLSANNGANLNTAKSEVLEALVRFKFRQIAVSIDGATNATYQLYRIGGDVNVVLDHVRSINGYKRRYNSPYPHMIWQMIVFGFNEHEIDRAAAIARELGMGFRIKLAWGDFSPVKDVERIRNWFGAASREEYLKRTGEEYLSGLCHQLWDEPQINSDGKVLGCCRNFWGEFGGNAFVDSLDAVVNSEKMEYARAMLLGEAPPRADVPCTICSVYTARRDSGHWLTRRSTNAEQPDAVSDGSSPEPVVGDE